MSSCWWTKFLHIYEDLLIKILFQHFLKIELVMCVIFTLLNKFKIKMSLHQIPCFCIKIKIKEVF